MTQSSSPAHLKRMQGGQRPIPVKVRNGENRADMPRRGNGLKAERLARAAEAPSAINFGPLPSYLGYQIRQAQAAVFRDLVASIADLDVTPGEFGLLTMLGENPGISQVDLAAVYKLDKSTLSLALGRLVKRGLVRRIRSRDDERYYALWLQQPGRALLQQVRARVETQERAMDSALRRGERKLLLDMLQRVSAVLNR